jgi:hypothetical protein
VNVDSLPNRVILHLHRKIGIQPTRTSIKPPSTSPRVSRTAPLPHCTIIELLTTLLNHPCLAPHHSTKLSPAHLPPPSAIDAAHPRAARPDLRTWADPRARQARLRAGGRTVANCTLFRVFKNGKSYPRPVATRPTMRSFFLVAESVFEEWEKVNGGGGGWG